jgi:hypothetical protein
VRQTSRTGLIGYRETVQFCDGNSRVIAIDEIEGVEAATRQQTDLIRAHRTHRTQLALVAEALAQQAGNARLSAAYAADAAAAMTDPDLLASATRRVSLSTLRLQWP